MRIITAHPLPDGNAKLLITGGGAFNKFLIERINALCPCEIVIPDLQIIEYREALIFAFLGALYMADRTGCLDYQAVSYEYAHCFNSRCHSPPPVYILLESMTPMLGLSCLPIDFLANL
ncbi:hypothetical protein [uncultured Bacteroides sp.]|uniref:hypothetical protein n=1 Tax=uncultured Bacteroides sp. TaxID=162156 RepID=UPI00259B3EB4|nr:hypothetical protein [uncultured Bacteroides sp.]